MYIYICIYIFIYIYINIYIYMYIHIYVCTRMSYTSDKSKHQMTIAQHTVFLGR